MTGRACLAVLLAVWAAACSRIPDPPRAQDHHAVIAAVLRAQPDLAAERRRYLREFPDEQGLLSRLFDYRICVESRTAGRSQDFEPTTIGRFGRGERPAEPAWNRSTHRFAIAPEGLPPFLRRSWPLSICPSGTLRISNPQFLGQTARVFVELRCSGWCGGGGEMVLTKIRGRWEIQGWTHQWVA